MRKAKVTVPAVCTNIGPGVESLALALSLHLTVTFIERSDTHLLIESYGENGADFSPDCYHPVMYAALRVFQQVEDAPLGLRIDVRNEIPLHVGLGAIDAMTVAGLVGANSLMGNPLTRDELLTLGADLLGRADGLVGAMLGGLTVSASGASTVIYRPIEVEPFKVLVILPELEDYDAAAWQPPQVVDLPAALYNSGRQTLVVEALRNNDFELLEQVFDDHILEPQLGREIPGYGQVVAAAQAAGAVGVTISEKGPALLVFALYNHFRIADAIQSVFDGQDILSRVWTLQVDTQGVVVTAAETQTA